MRLLTTPFALALALAVLAVPARSQPLADRAPEDTIAYIGWAGADAPGAGYDASHLKGVIQGSDLPKFFNEFLPRVLQRAAQGQPDAARGMAGWSASVHLWRHPTAIFFAGIENTLTGPMPKLTLVCRAGEDAEAMRQQWEAAVANEPAGPWPAQIFRAGDLVGLTNDPKGPDAALAARPAGSLVSNDRFKSALSVVLKEPTFVVYVDAEAALKMVDALVAKQNDPAVAQNWPTAREALGLGGLKRFIWTQGFDGKDWGTRVFVDAPAPRQGALGMLGAPALGDAVLKSVPATATVAGATHFDLAGVVDGIRSAAVAFDPAAGDRVDSVLGLMSGMLGVDVRQDLLGSLGDEWAYYADPMVGGRGAMGFVFVNRLKDEAKAIQALGKLRQGINRAIVAQGGGDVKVRVKETKVGGVAVTYLGVPFITPSWAVDKGNLYVASYPQVVAAAAAHGASGQKSILDNPDFVALRKRLGGAGPSSIQFMDLPKTAPGSYQSWLMFSSFAKFGDVFGVESPAVLLPTMDVLMAHLAPAGSASWADDRGLHYRGVSPFPLSTVLAADTAGMLDMQTTAFAVSIMLPALNRAREQANRVKSASNLRQIGQAVQMHANDNKGRFPDDVTDLLKQELPPEVFGNPRREGVAPPAGASPDQIAQWVRDSSEYVYRGKGKNYKMTGAEVLAYEKPEGLNDGINILFGDGHVEFVPMPAAQEMIRTGRKPGRTSAGDL
jgi:prepilin-type processing-associated H-X9-DG protein